MLSEIKMITKARKSAVQQPVSSSKNLFEPFRRPDSNPKLRQSQILLKAPEDSQEQLAGVRVEKKDKGVRGQRNQSKIQPVQSREQSKESYTSKTSMSDAMEMDTISEIKVRVVGVVIMLVLLVGVLFHAFSSTINTGYFTSLQSNALVGAGTMLTMVFVVLGFSLILAYFGQNIHTAFFIVLYIVTMSLLLEPFLLKFWISIAKDGFSSSLPTQNSALTVLFTSNNGDLVSINYWNMRVALISAISQLIIYVGVIGHIQIYKVAIANLFFMIAWTLNYAIIVHFISISPEARINDDYSICLVYLFGGFAGLAVLLDTPSRLLIKLRSNSQQPIAPYSKIFSTIGAFFLWMAFVFTHATVGKKNGTSTFEQANDQRVVFLPQGAIGMFFALSSSVLSTAAFSVLLNGDHKMGLIDFIGGTISGAIMFGPVAGFSSNLAIPITLGLAGGFLCVLYKAKVLPRLNKVKLRDSMGFLGPFLMVPLVGNFVSTPVVIYTYSLYGITTPQLGFSSIGSVSSSRYIYILNVLASILGLVAGMAMSSIFRWFKGNQTHFGDRLAFIQQLSLREIEIDYEEYSTNLFTSEEGQSASSEKNIRKNRKALVRKNTGREQI